MELISDEQLKSIIRASFRPEENMTYESTVLDASNKAAAKYNSNLSSDTRQKEQEENDLAKSLANQSRFNYYLGQTSEDKTLESTYPIDTSEAKTILYNNSDIQVAYESKADAMSNAFDVFFVDFNNMTNDQSKDWTNVDSNPFMRLMLAKVGTTNDGLTYSDRSVSNDIRNIYNPQVIGVRIQSIDISQIRSETTDVPFLTRNVTKQSGAVSFSHDGAFSIRLDQDLYLADLFQMLSGKRVWRNKDKKEMHDIGETWGRSQRQLGIESSESDTSKSEDTDPSNQDQKTNSYHLDNPGMCIIVRTENLSPSSEDLYKRGIIKNTTFSPLIESKKMPFFIFERVKFLGSGDSLNFSESASPISMNVKFVYRRMYKVVNSSLPTSLNDFSSITGNILQLDPSTSDVSLSDVLQKIADNDSKFYEGAQ